MADPLTAMVLILTSSLGEIIKWLIGLAIFGFIVWMVIKIWFQPKPSHMNKIIFDKNFDATNDRLRFQNPKTLELVPMQQNIDEIRKLPEYTIHHRPFGLVTGVNIYPIIHDLNKLKEFANKGDKETYQKLLDSNADYIKDDKFWIAFSYTRKIGGMLGFPKIKKSMIYIKPNQLININSADNVISVRGFGIQPIGEYELVVDENANINMKQFIKDQGLLVSREVELSGWDDMKEVAIKAMGMDTNQKKELINKNMGVNQPPIHQESQI